MGRLKELDKETIKIYLNYDNKKINSKWIYYSALANIALSISAWFIDKNIINIFYASFISIFSIVVSLCFNFKADRSKKSLYFFYACNMVMLPINLCYLSCLVLNGEGVNPLVPAVFFIVAVPIISIVTLKVQMQKIISQKYINTQWNGPSKSIIFSSSLFAVLIADRVLDIRFLIIGVLLGVLGLIMSTNTYFFLKSYCYYLLDRTEKTGDE